VLRLTKAILIHILIMILDSICDERATDQASTHAEGRSASHGTHTWTALMGAGTVMASSEATEATEATPVVLLRVTAVPRLLGVVPLLSGIPAVVTGRRSPVPAITWSAIIGSAVARLLAVWGRRAISSSVVTTVASTAAHQSAKRAQTTATSVPAAPGLLAQELAEQPLALIGDIARSRWEHIRERRGALCLWRRGLHVGGRGAGRDTTVWSGSRSSILLLLQLTGEPFVFR
jgi:hypothetical protein